MRAGILARLAADSEAPSGVAVRVDAAEMKRLLEEREMFIEACEVALVEMVDPSLDLRPKVVAVVRAAILNAESE